jgi:hypothetical protein
METFVNELPIHTLNSYSEFLLSGATRHLSMMHIAANSILHFATVPLQANLILPIRNRQAVYVSLRDNVSASECLCRLNIAGAAPGCPSGLYINEKRGLGYLCSLVI